MYNTILHEVLIKRKHFPCYWPFVWGIHRWIPLTKASDVELWYFLWSNVWVNNWDTSDLRRHWAHKDITEMWTSLKCRQRNSSVVRNRTCYHILQQIPLPWGRYTVFSLVVVALWHHMVTLIWINIGSSNGLLPDGTRPLPEPVLVNHEWGSVALT